MTQQQTVFVTGASAGFGDAIARRFVAEGARVIAVARSADKLGKLAGELGGAVLPVKLDVSDPDAVKRTVAGLPEDWKTVDVLVNNAGLAKGLEPAHQADLGDWDQMIATNVRGLAHVTRALLPGMVERGRGHVINIGSIAGTYPYPGGNVYGATKAFVHQFSLNLRSDLHGTGVRVTNIEPGMVGGTDFSKVRFDGDAAKADKVYEGTTPLTAEDVAESVYWAASQPKHVNINVIELMPVVQSFSALQIYRES
ncbi:SDR family oxidoreductase [Amycolatopsis australiensis]|uniref:3-hydroxy acid dehydrogenase / malonic semialdehyde reductase n=1 Tax=Amycolatopsis australiensis TaxID=546364 RepID=A0A1K1RJ61_9PSEU|nr:SDR family oxidoreductase [Amycolatopsis australiensis]SFW72112.1 3-hydroxy acid dehydrogenase / malonic semialdehyde reductase [Amycolatopsis australiensis]